SVQATGVEAASAEADVLSPETYVGYDRAERFVSPGGPAKDKRRTYVTGDPRLNEWGLSGDWTIGPEHATLDAKAGAVSYRFHARDVHLVLGGAAPGQRIRFRVSVDGAAPGESRGGDVDADGRGAVTEQRLYQLIRQRGPVAEHTFEIQFLDRGV